MYRDETEMLRRELETVRAELARLKQESEPKRTEIVWRNEDGSLMSWAHTTMMIVLGASFLSAVVALLLFEQGNRSVAIVLFAVAVLGLSGCALVGWELIPRRPVQ